VAADAQDREQQKRSDQRRQEAADQFTSSISSTSAPASSRAA
jgi:hypothetical protein